MKVQLSLLPDLVEETLDPIDAIKSRQLPDWPIVVSYGGGTNSTALIIASRLKREAIDCILFADTGNEHPATYRFLEYFDEWLQKPWYVGNEVYPPMPGITVVKKAPNKPGHRKKLEALLVKEFCQIKPLMNPKIFYSVWFPGWVLKACIELHFVGETLGEDVLIQQKLPSKAYGYGSCSAEWKIRVMEKFIKDKYGSQKVVQFVGIHAGETGRLFDRKGNLKPIETDMGVIHYPLIADGLNQNECLKLCTFALGENTPRKSSCWFCPNAKVHEVRELAKEYPEYYELGCFMEEQNARNKPENSTVVGLGRSFAWSDLELLSESEQLQIDSIKSHMQCSCTD